MWRFDSLASEFRESQEQDANTNGAGSSPETANDQAGTQTDPDKSKSEGSDAGTQKGEEGKKTEGKEDQKVPFHKHPRFVDLNTKYNNAKTQLEAKDARIAELEAQVASGGKGEVKKPEDMSIEEYNEWILSEARRVAQEAVWGGKEKKEEKQDDKLDTVLSQIDSEFANIRDFDDNFTDQDEEAVIELCMNPPEGLVKTLWGRPNPTIREAYKFFKKSKADVVSEEKRKQAEIKSGGTTSWGNDGEYKHQTFDDLKRAGLRAISGR